jgi:hypothetical protein
MAEDFRRVLMYADGLLSFPKTRRAGILAMVDRTPRAVLRSGSCGWRQRERGYLPAHFSKQVAVSTCSTGEGRPGFPFFAVLSFFFFFSKRPSA